MRERQMSVIYRFVIFAYCIGAQILRWFRSKPWNIVFSRARQGYPQAPSMNLQTIRDITDTFGISRTVPCELPRYITGHLFAILRTFSPRNPAPYMGLTDAKRLNFL